MTHPTHLLVEPPTAPAALARVRRWPSAEARAWVAELVAELSERPEVHAILAYGSAVREGVESGDVDLLVVHDAPVEIPVPPLDVDLRGYARATVDEEIARGHEVLGWAVRYGAVLWERDGFWTALAERWRPVLPLPSAEAADARAARAQRLHDELRAAGDDDAAREQLTTALTQRARARLIRAGVFPRSRPELPAQLIAIGDDGLAAELSRLLERRAS